MSQHILEACASLAFCLLCWGGIALIAERVALIAERRRRAP